MSVYSNSHLYSVTSCAIMDPGPTISRSSSKDRLAGRSWYGEAAMLRLVHGAQNKRRLPGSICCCDAWLGWSSFSRFSHLLRVRDSSQDVHDTVPHQVRFEF